MPYKTMGPDRINRGDATGGDDTEKISTKKETAERLQRQKHTKCPQNNNQGGGWKLGGGGKENKWGEKVQSAGGKRLYTL